MRAFAPSLAVGLPEEWFGKASLTVIAPDGEVNVIVSSEPVEYDMNAVAYAAFQGHLLRGEFAEYEELSFQPARIFGRRAGWERVYRWTPPDGDAVIQIQLYYAAGGRAYVATATARPESFGQNEAELREVLGSVRLVAASHAASGGRLGLRRRPA